MGYRGYRSSSTDSETVLKVWLGSLALLVAAYWYLIQSGIFGDLFHVVFSHMTFWIVYAALAAFGVWWWRKHENFSRGELWFFLAIAPFFAFPGCAFGYFYCTDLGDIEVWNGEAVRVEYTERYGVRHTDSKGRTSWTYHGPYYHVYTNNPGESTDMEKVDWNAYVEHWGGSSRLTSRLNPSADDAARIHTITWDNRDESRVATAIEHPFVNYLRASNSILNTQGTMSGYEELLRPYPRVRDGTFGPVEIDRVICAGVTLPEDFVKCLDRTLDNELRTLGKEKEVNILVYFVGDADEGFFHALEDYWDMAKDNDCVVVIGTTTGTSTIAWCQILSWTERMHFKELLADRVRGSRSLTGTGQELAELIINQVRAAGNEGFLRRPLSDFRSLASEVRLPIWAHILVMVLMAVFMMPTVWLCIHD